MPTQPPLFDDFVESDPPTLNGLGLGEVAPANPGEWALIRYVGNPIGEVLPLGPTDCPWAGRRRTRSACPNPR